MLPPLPPLNAKTSPTSGTPWERRNIHNNEDAGEMISVRDEMQTAWEATTTDMGDMTTEAYEMRMAREVIKMDKDETMLDKDKIRPVNL